MPGRLKVWDGAAWQYQVSPPAADGGLPDGWTQDGNPADLDAHGGSLAVGDPDASSLRISGNTISLFAAGAPADLANITNGIVSRPLVAGEVHPAAFRAGDDNGATVALDAGGLAIINLPTVDPGIAGALWNDAGTPAISTG